MDFRVKVVNAPSVADAVRRRGKCVVNGLLFGFSDKLGAVVSEPANAAHVEPFRRVPGYVIVDAVSGDLVSEPEPVKVTTEKTESRPTDPDAAWLESFATRFAEASEAQRERIGNDEYKRALRQLKVAFDPEAKKADLIALVAEALAGSSDEGGSDGQ
jgi:hypothetical protein